MPKVKVYFLCPLFKSALGARWFPRILPTPPAMPPSSPLNTVFIFQQLASLSQENVHTLLKQTHTPSLQHKVNGISWFVGCLLVFCLWLCLSVCVAGQRPGRGRGGGRWHCVSQGTWQHHSCLHVAMMKTHHRLPNMHAVQTVLALTDGPRRYGRNIRFLISSHTSLQHHQQTQSYVAKRAQIF